MRVRSKLVRLQTRSSLWTQATVIIPLEEAQNVTVMKMEGLSTARDNTAYVYKEDENGEMVESPVTVGVSNGNYVEIKDGIDVVQLLPYHKFGATKYDRLGIKYKLSNVEPPSDEFMQDALQLFQDMGLNAMIH